MLRRLIPVALLVIPSAIPAQADPVWKLDGGGAAGAGDRFDRMPPGWHITTKERGGP